MQTRDNKEICNRQYIDWRLEKIFPMLGQGGIFALYSVEIGMNIVKLRKARGMTQEQLGLQANVSITRLRDIEHGRANASMDTLKSIADFWGVALPMLFINSLEPVEVLEMLYRAQPEALTAG